MSFPMSDVRLIVDEKARQMTVQVGCERRTMTTGEWSRLIANPETVPVLAVADDRNLRP
jgi:hypothetical protein